MLVHILFIWMKHARSSDKLPIKSNESLQAWHVYLLSVKSDNCPLIEIDYLSWLFLFDEAEKILAEYEISNSPCLPMYSKWKSSFIVDLSYRTILMSDARNCRNSVLAEKMYNRMKTRFPDQKITWSRLTNGYSSLEDYDQAEAIQLTPKADYGNKVKSGTTWTENDGEIVVRDFLLYCLRTWVNGWICLGIPSLWSFAPTIARNSRWTHTDGTGISLTWSSFWSNMDHSFIS